VDILSRKMVISDSGNCVNCMPFFFKFDSTFAHTRKHLMTFDIYFVLAGLGGLPTIGMLAVPLLSLFMSPVKAAVLHPAMTWRQP
jgi:hypothetical protein